MKYFSALKGGWFWEQRIREKKKTKGKKSLLKSLKQLASQIYIQKNYGIENSIQFRQKCLRNKHCKDNIYARYNTIQPDNKCIIWCISFSILDSAHIIFSSSGEKGKFISFYKLSRSTAHLNFKILIQGQTLCLTSALALILPCFLVSCISCPFLGGGAEIHAIH